MVTRLMPVLYMCTSGFVCILDKIKSLVVISLAVAASSGSTQIASFWHNQYLESRFLTMVLMPRGCARTSLAISNSANP
jgi:hypothetical protein